MPVLSTASVTPLAAPFDSWLGLLFLDDTDLPGYLRRGSARETARGEVRAAGPDRLWTHVGELSGREAGVLHC